jgi:hypothetical protein
MLSNFATVCPTLGLCAFLAFQAEIPFCTIGGSSAYGGSEGRPQKADSDEHWKARDWIDHASLGVGQGHRCSRALSLRFAEFTQSPPLVLRLSCRGAQISSARRFGKPAKASVNDSVLGFRDEDQ